MNKELFEDIVKWQKDTFKSANALSKIAHLTEEVEELQYDIEYYKSPEETSMEFADCFLLLYGAASAYGMSYADIEKAIGNKLEINKGREWGEPDENGVVKHIK